MKGKITLWKWAILFSMFVVTLTPLLGDVVGGG